MYTVGFGVLVQLLLITLTSIVCIDLNPKGPIHQNYSTNCIMEIIEHQFVPEHKLLAILTTPNMTTSAFGIQNSIIKHINHILKWSVEIVSSDLKQFESSEICLNCPVQEGEEKLMKNIFQPKYNAEFCLMVADNLESFFDRLQNFMESEIRNLRAFFLIYLAEISPDYEKLAEDVLNFLWQNKIFNSAVIVGRNSLRFLNIYGLDVYAPSETCGSNPKLLLVDTCKKGKIKKNVKLFGNKLPRKFGNCTIETIAMKYPPFIIDKNEGFEVNVLREFGKILDINFNLFTAEAIDWGSRLSKDNWTGPLGDALNISAIAIGNVMANPDLAEDFTLSVAYFYEYMIWVVPKALPLERWKNIFVIFRYQLWLFCIGYIMLTAILFQITSRSKDELQRYKDIGTNFLTALRVLVGSSNPKNPKTTIVRMIFMALATYSIVLVVLYESLLITYLTNPVYEKQIASVTDILESGKGIGGLESQRDFFNVTQDDRAMKIFRMFKVNEEVNSTAYFWILTVGKNRDICTISSSFYVKFLLTENDYAVTTVSGKPKIFVLKEIVFPYPISMVLPKDFPIAEMFNKIIWHLLNGGIVAQWAKSYHQHMKNQNKTNNVDNEDDSKQLKIDHLQGAFNLLVVGYVCGMILLLFEIIFIRIEKSKRYYNIKSYCKKCTKKNK